MIALALSLMLAAAADAPVQTAPTKGTAVAVLATSADEKSKDVASALEAQLHRALTGKGVETVDYDALFPPPAPASKEEIDFLLKEGREAYDNLDLETAYDRFFSAAKWFQNHPVETKPRDFADTFILLGAAALNKGDRGGASSAFAKAIITDPAAKPDGTKLGQNVVDAFDAASIAVAARQRGTLIVDSVPRGGKVFIRGVDEGVTPVSPKELPYGRYHVLVTRPGYVPFAAFPDVGAAKETLLQPILDPNPGLAQVLVAADKLMTPLNFDAKAPPPEAKPVAEKLKARYLVVTLVSTDANGVAEARLQTWDLKNASKMRDVKFTVDDGWRNTYDAADRVELWLTSPQGVREIAKVEEKPIEFNVPPVMKKWWFWAAVGGAAAVGGGTWYVATHPARRSGFVLGIP